MHLASQFARLSRDSFTEAHRRLARRQGRARQPVDPPRRAGRRRRGARPLLRRRRPAPRAAGVRAPRRPAHQEPRHLQGCAAGRRRAHRLGRRRAHRPARPPAPTATSRTATSCSPTAPVPTPCRTSRSRPATSRAPVTRARPADSTTSSSSTSWLAASREDEARRLVVRGFLTEIVQKIGSPELEARLVAAIEAELQGH